MSTDFTLNAQAREPRNKGASRRLRRQGRVPGIIYGGHETVAPISVPNNELERNLEYESFYSQVITVTIGKKKEDVILKELQRHPAKAKVVHLDLQRVVAGEAINVRVPLHFIGEEDSPGVQESEGVVERHRNDIEVSCLPKDLPEYIEVDISGLEVEDSLHLSEIALPSGVEPTELSHDDDITLVSIHHSRVEEAAEEAAEELEALEGLSEEEIAELEEKETEEGATGGGETPEEES